MECVRNIILSIIMVSEIDMIFNKKSEEYNSLVKRKEVEFEIDHTNEGTPSRSDVILCLALEYKVKKDVIVLKKIVSESGTNTALGYAEIYDNVKGLRKFTPQHLRKRNDSPT